MQNSNLHKFTDHKLLRLLKKDNRFAFNEIYNRYWSELYYTVFEMLKDKAIAGDIVQDVMVSLWIRRKHLEVDTLSSYLFRAIKLKTFQHLRNGKTAQYHLERMESIRFANTTEDHLDFSELREALNNSLAQLPEKCRQVFELSRFEQLSHQEIAQKLGISQKTVANHINRALKQLRHSVGRSLSAIIVFLSSF